MENHFEEIWYLQEQKESKESLLIKPSISIREEIDLITRKSVGELLKNPKYHISKKAILEYRKSFIKTLDSLINDPRIQKLPRKNLIRM